MNAQVPSPQPEDTNSTDPASDATEASVLEPSPKENQPSADEINVLRKEIDWLDAEILRLIMRRVEVSKTIGAARMAAGGTRIVYNREMDVLARYRVLGPEGRELAMALLNLGRGRLGR